MRRFWNILGFRGKKKDKGTHAPIPKRPSKKAIEKEDKEYNSPIGIGASASPKNFTKK